MGLVTMLLAGRALAVDGWSGWDDDRSGALDRDGDGDLEPDELGRAYGDFGDADQLAEDELYAGLFDTWDETDDDALSEDELHRGFHDAWDVDADGLVDVNEFGAGWSALVGADLGAGA